MAAFQQQDAHRVGWNVHRRDCVMKLWDVPAKTTRLTALVDDVRLTVHPQQEVCRHLNFPARIEHLKAVVPRVAGPHLAEFQ